MKPSLRMERVQDLLHRELAKLISKECKDPRLGMVTVSAVIVSRDLAHAKVFITIFEDEKQTQSLEILNNSAGFLRCMLAKQLVMRTVPSLRFIFDSSLQTGNVMDTLIDSVVVADVSGS